MLFLLWFCLGKRCWRWSGGKKWWVKIAPWQRCKKVLKGCQRAVLQIRTCATAVIGRASWNSDAAVDRQDPTHTGDKTNGSRTFSVLGSEWAKLFHYYLHFQREKIWNILGKSSEKIKQAQGKETIFLRTVRRTGKLDVYQWCGYKSESVSTACTSLQWRTESGLVICECGQTLQRWGSSFSD